MRLLDKVMQQKAQQRQADMLRGLIRQEARLGGELFGQVPAGHRREFFCLDRHTWVWHEEWQDQAGHHVMTTRYDIRPNGILKVQGNSGYQPLSADEARNLYRATKLYKERVGGMYQQLLAA